MLMTYVLCIVKFIWIFKLLILAYMILSANKFIRRHALRNIGTSIIFIEFLNGDYKLHRNNGLVIRTNNIHKVYTSTFCIVLKVKHNNKIEYITIFYDAVTLEDFRRLSLYCQCVLIH